MSIRKKLTPQKNNFFNKENAKILEDLLDKGFLELKFIISALHSIKFFTKPYKSPAILENLNELSGAQYDLILPWKAREESRSRLYISRKKEFISDTTIVNVNEVLRCFIKNSVIYPEIILLPRIFSEPVVFKPVDSYYEKYFYSPLSVIIESQENYINEIPKILNFHEAKKMFPIENQIFECLYSQKLGLYLQTNNVIIDQDHHDYSCNECRLDNAGNPLFLKRYRTLERIEIKDIETLQMKNKILLKDYPLADYLFGKSLRFQSTDIESKLHITRHLDSTKEEREYIDISDFVFLKNDIDKLIKEIDCGQSFSSKSEDASLSLTRSAIRGIFKGGSKKLNDTKWKYLFDNEKQNEIANTREKNQRNKAVYNQEKLSNWLIENGYFTPVELKKLLCTSESSSKIFSFEKIQ